ncbi:ABC transporter permease [Desulfurococcus amylolyticus]|uniref:ABC-type tungstate transport system, periplasmic component, TupA n=1 Tax=Desulfurococcus amylolyticus DSM 16532 TaxID=768672 RepID=I3XQ46_DESAM|nr:ABC transporter permease [Desulfurococcus amylolyticus]AFL66070.1 ABC-type tungstate transport system, periplasmic component, TupA [Desulfurococcus amylolyticus DSM 16532]
MSEVIDISIRSITISGLATLLSLSWSLPIAYLAVVKQRLRIIIPIAESLSGFPTVLIGLLLYMLLSRSGPLGFLHLLYTPSAIIIGQSILVTPLIIAIVYGHLKKIYEEIGELLLTLGARGRDIMLSMLTEASNRILASSMIAFSRALGELGVALMLGGNIAGETRVFSTAIALSVNIGEFENALNLGLILFIIETMLITAIRILQGLER